MRKFPAGEIKEFKIFKKLTSPQKIQDFLDGIPMNFEKRGEEHKSPLMTLRRNNAHCIEGALLAAAALWYNGKKPLLLDLKTSQDDEDHVVALFKDGSRWGAISKTNHAVLRYRDPIYISVRELAASYFNEYFLDSRKKTLRSYSAPFELLKHDDSWLTTDKNLWNISDALDEAKHFPLFGKNLEHKLRQSDQIEIKAGDIAEW